MLFGRVRVVIAQILLGFRIFVERLGRNRQLAGGHGVLAAHGIGEFEIGLLEMEHQGDAPVRVGGAGSHLGGLAGFSAPGLEDRDDVGAGWQLAEVEAAAGVAQSGGFKRAGRTEQGDGRAFAGY